MRSGSPKARASASRSNRGEELVDEDEGELGRELERPSEAIPFVRVRRGLAARWSIGEINVGGNVDDLGCN